MPGLYAKHGTLAASVVTTIDLQDGQYPVLVMNRGSTDLFCRFDGVAPTVSGDNCFIVQAGTAKTFTLGGGLIISDRQIQLISSGVPDFSVEMG